MIRTVAKHRYFKGKGAKGSVRQYIGYLAFRAGSDARVNGRQFFDEDFDKISYAKMKAVFAYDPIPGQPVLTHELILSPGVQSVDTQRYTRVLMSKLERSMGRNLKWAAIEHKGRNNHIHVFIDGKDKAGMRVYLRREEYKRLREWGDRYLDKEHGLERYLDKEVDLNAPFEREKGDALYETLFEKAGKENHSQSESPIVDTKKLFGSWDQSKAIAELNDENKIYLNGKSYHQFNTTKDLYSLLKKNRDDMSDEQIAKVKQWIDDKESFGDDHHERLERESIVRRNRRIRKPRRNKKQDSKQDNKESEIVRGKRNLNVSKVRKEIPSINPFAAEEEITEEDDKGDRKFEFVSDDEQEIRIQLRRVDEERIAQLKNEVESEREFVEKIDKETDVQRELDLKTQDDSLNISDQARLPANSHSENDAEIKHQEKIMANEREKVEVRLEQERNSRLSKREYSSLLQGYRRYLKSRSTLALMRKPCLQRFLHENDREGLWQDRHIGSVNQADLHELPEKNAELESSQDQSLSAANYEHRNIQPRADHPLSLQPDRSETWEDLLGLDTNRTTEKTNHEKDNPSDEFHKDRSSHSKERNEDEWKR